MTDHKQVRAVVGGKTVKVDVEIVELIEVLNKYGIKTKHSCQGDKRGYISIDINNVEVWVGKVNDAVETNFNLRFETP